jgi:hypothetical protein
MPPQTRGMNKGKVSQESQPFQPFHNNWDELSEGLGFDTVKHCQEWFKSDFFQYHFNILKRESLDTKAEKRKSKGHTFNKGWTLKDVQKRLNQNEAGGQATYSNPIGPDKSQWDDKDHLAYFLHKAVEHNTTTRNGIFYKNPNFSTLAARQHAIWEAHLYAKH